MAVLMLPSFVGWSVFYHVSLTIPCLEICLRAEVSISNFGRHLLISGRTVFHSDYQSGLG